MSSRYSLKGHKSLAPSHPILFDLMFVVFLKFTLYISLPSFSSLLSLLSPVSPSISPYPPLSLSLFLSLFMPIFFLHDIYPLSLILFLSPSFSSTQSTDTSKKLASSSSSSTASADTKPKPARKEDCVFEATAANFQQLVLESKVPVLVDIYADWCGPCKQLGPMLESAAMKSGESL